MFYGYKAIFFKTSDIQRVLTELGLDQRLAKKPENFHTTVEYFGPKEPAETTLAELRSCSRSEVEVTVIAYGNDGQTEGLKVQTLSGDKQVDGTPYHITLSFADGAKAVQTGKNPFDKPVGPVSLRGLMGWSLDPYFKGQEYQL